MTSTYATELAHWNKVAEQLGLGVEMKEMAAARRAEEDALDDLAHREGWGIKDPARAEAARQRAEAGAAARAAELREQAAEHDRKAHESYERCDTDGALSQVADGLLGAQARLQAHIEEAGGLALFPALFDTAGNLVPAKRMNGKWGAYWALLDENRRITGVWFTPSKASNARRARAADAAKGYYVGQVMAPAKAELRGGNIACLNALAVRTDGGYSTDVEVVDNGQHDEYGKILGRHYAIQGDLI